MTQEDRIVDTVGGSIFGSYPPSKKELEERKKQEEKKVKKQKKEKKNEHKNRFCYN